MQSEITKFEKEFLEKNFHRLINTKKLIDGQPMITIEKIRQKIGGSSIMFTLLKQKNIIIFSDGICKWNENIPITKKLARTITGIVKERNEMIRNSSARLKEFRELGIDRDCVSYIKAVERNSILLNSVKEHLDNNKCKYMKELEGLFKGTSLFYTIIYQHKIVIKENNLLKWNPEFLINKKLSKMVSDYLFIWNVKRERSKSKKEVVKDGNIKGVSSVKPKASIEPDKEIPSSSDNEPKESMLDLKLLISDLRMKNEKYEAELEKYRCELILIDGFHHYVKKEVFDYINQLKSSIARKKTEPLTIEQIILSTVGLEYDEKRMVLENMDTETLINYLLEKRKSSSGTWIESSGLPIFLPNLKDVNSHFNFKYNTEPSLKKLTKYSDAIPPIKHKEELKPTFEISILWGLFNFKSSRKKGNNQHDKGGVVADWKNEDERIEWQLGLRLKMHKQNVSFRDLSFMTSYDKSILVGWSNGDGKTPYHVAMEIENYFKRAK